MATMSSLLQKLAQQQNRNLRDTEKDIAQLSDTPTNTQLMIAQMMNSQPQQPAPQEPPMQMAANQADPYGGVSMQTRRAMHQMGAADPTGEMGDMMIGRQTTPQGFAAKTSVRGKQSPAQEEQLIRMLMGRGMSREEAQARVSGL